MACCIAALVCSDRYKVFIKQKKLVLFSGVALVTLASLSDKIPEAECHDYKYALRKDIYAVLSPKIERDRAKKQFGQFAFGSYKRKNEFGKAFAARFPTLTKMIRSFPRNASEEKTLNCILQDLEAEICIYSVVKQCMEQGVFVVPVHDSFIIKSEAFEFINSLVSAEFERRFNFPLALKPKRGREPPIPVIAQSGVTPCYK